MEEEKEAPREPSDGQKLIGTAILIFSIPSLVIPFTESLDNTEAGPELWFLISCGFTWLGIKLTGWQPTRSLMRATEAGASLAESAWRWVRSLAAGILIVCGASIGATGWVLLSEAREIRSDLAKEIPREYSIAQAEQTMRTREESPRAQRFLAKLHTAENLKWGGRAAIVLAAALVAAGVHKTVSSSRA